MSSNKYVADTNTFLMLLAEQPSIKSHVDNHWHFHFITEIELLGKVGITPREVGSIKGLLKICTKIRHNESITLLAISLRQRFRLKVADAVIAATAIYSEMPLLTYDKDFAHIGNLNVKLLEI
ncbi:MAG TPA: PIN domain-containing protein [Chryseosolibacter sp.]